MNRLTAYARRLPRASIAVYLFYLAIAVLITWPLVTVFSTHFPGFSDGDAHEMTRHIWWFKYALQHGQPLIFQPLLGYPDGIQGVILWSDPLQFFPGWLFAFFMPLPAAYNLFVLLTLALNGWAAYWLMSRLLSRLSVGTQRAASLPEPPPPNSNYTRHLPAVFAGLVFMAAPTIQGHLAGGHGGLLVQWPLPLLAYCLLKLCGFLDNPSASVTLRSRLKYGLLSVLLVFIVPMGHTLQLIYAVIPLVGVLGLTLLIRHDWKALLRLILAVAAGGALLLVLLLPVFSATFGTSAYTDEGGGVRYSADLLSIVTPSFEHILFGQLDYTHRVLGVNIVEGSSYIGIIAALLGIIAFWKVRPARWWLALAVIVWLLSLGPLLKLFDAPLQTSVDGHETYITLPWALLYNLPGFNLARSPGRFNFLLALAVAVLAGYGFAVVQSKIASRQPANNPSRRFKLLTLNFAPALITRYSSLITFLFLSTLVLFEYQSFWPLPTYSAEIPQAVYDLAKRDDVRAVFDIPWDNVLAAKDALWLQTAHQKPMIAGQVTRSTPVSPAKLTILQQTLDPALLDEAGVDVVIVHKQYDAQLTNAAREKLGRPFFENDQIAMFDVPSGKGDPGFVSVPLSDLPAVVNDQTSIYIYTNQPAWIDYSGRLDAQEMSFQIRLDGQVVHQQTANGITDFSFALPLPEAGYHTISLALPSPCPSNPSEALECRSLQVSALQTNGWVLAPVTPVLFDHGVTLSGSLSSYIDAFPRNYPGIARLGLMLSLGWRFDQTITDQDIRFIKILDSQGNQVLGDDHPLGSFVSGDQWVETLWLDLPDDLAPGMYKVYVGWYSYPDLNRFAVLSDVPGAQDGLAQIAEFTVPAKPLAEVS